MNWQWLSIGVHLGCGTGMGEGTPQGGESWEIHFVQHQFIVLVNALACLENTEVC